MKGKERNKRQSVNAVSLLVTSVFLILAVQFSDGGGKFAEKINKITENLDKAVLGLNENVTYSNFKDNSKYLSSTKFKAGGMAGLYNLTNMFVDMITPEDILMNGVISIDNNKIQANVPETSEILRYYRSLVAVTIFLVVCVLLFPLCGLCFCCCRCCGNCGAKPRASDKNKDTWKKVLLATLLILCGTGLLYCIVCAFGSNQQLQDGIKSFPTDMNTGLTDIQTFMTSTNGQLTHLLVDNYGEFSKAFNSVMENSTKIAMEQLMVYSNATAVSEISTFANNLGHINETLYTLKTDTNRLRVLASQLNDAIRKVKRDLGNTLKNCALQECVQLQSTVAALQTSIDFNLVPDVSSTINSLNSLEIDQIQSAASQANSSLQGISDAIDKQLNKGLVAAREQINNTGSTIEEQLSTVTDAINQIKNQISDTASPAIDTSKDYIDEYSKYRYGVGLAISCSLLLVTVCIMFGLICGICGKRPDGYSDNCCNKGAGGQFLICAVMIMFLFGFIISIITLVSLIVGVLSEKAICEPLRNPDPDKFNIIRLVDDFNLNFDVDITPSELLNNCYNNKSIYRTFNLESKFNLNDIRTKFNISDQLSGLNIDGAIPDDFQLLSPDQLDILETLKTFEPNLNVDKFMEELQKNLTNYSLNDLANSLEIIISQLNGPGTDDVRSQLQLNLLLINTYDEKLIVPMKNLAGELMTTAEKLNTDLKMNKSSFEEAIQNLIEEIIEAQKALSDSGPQYLKQIAKEFTAIVENVINGYLDRVTDHIEDRIGLCGPLNLVIHAGLTSTCDKVLLPWNGFWFSLFWTVILYIITIVIAVILAKLYQKHKPYDQYVETEYLYDAYADRGDNIPLNSRAGKRNKKKGKKSKRYEERPNVGREVARDYAAGSHPPDGRYADMAPKHWDEFPNGGPPHYQRAPTEYERPPPYYYAGSGGEQ